MRGTPVRLLVPACAWLIVACGGGGGGGGGSPATALSVAITPVQVVIPLGLDVQFKAECSYSDGHVHDVTASATWTSNDSTVATIDVHGKAHAAGAGTCTITCGFEGFGDATTLEVGPPVLSTITISPAGPSVPRGDTLQLTATGTFTDGSALDLTTSATWSVLNPSVASVDASGLAHALQIGSTSVRALFGGLTGATSFTVIAPPLVSIQVLPDLPSVPRGLPVAFHATGTYSDASTQDLTTSATWSSSSPAVATIAQNGVAATLTAGTTTIRAVKSGVEGTTTLTVTPETLVSIQVTPAASKVERGSTRSLVALGTYTNQSVHDLTALATWTSADPTIATIVGPGSARGLLPAVVTITAQHGAVSGTGALHVYLPLARTGQTTCFDTAGAVIPCAATGQDGELQRGATWPTPRFVPGGGAEAGTVTDLLTGLMWRAAPDGQTAWNWEQALQTANTLVVSGHDDWRLATRRELKSLVHHGTSNTATWLQGQGFSVVSTDWWSSTTLASIPDNAWNVDMLWGAVDVYDKLGGPRFWAVRTADASVACRAAATGQTTCTDEDGNPIACAGTGQDGDLRPGVRWPAPRFVPGTGRTADLVVDVLTGLEWLRAPDGVPRTWAGALQYARDLVAGGYDDWRVPNVLELESLYNAGVVNSAAWLDSQGFSGAAWDYHWSSTTVALDTPKAWALHLGLGYVYFHPKDTTRKVWVVRGP